MESSKAGRKLCSSCPWDRSGSSLFHRILSMATAVLARSSAPVRPSFLRWSCFPSRTRPKQKLRQNSSANKESKTVVAGTPEFRLAEELLLLQAFCLKPFENARLHSGVIAKPGKPAHVRFFTKPGELPLGVTAGGLLNRGPRFFQSNLAPEDRAQFPVANKIKWFGVLAETALKERLHFAHPSLHKHGVCSGVDALVEFLARRQ